METLSGAASYTLRFINQTHKSVFLTGKAGTGKTTLLKEIIKTTHKNVVVVAPTGIAALNAGGVTIHSMFQLPFAGFIPEYNHPPQFSDVVKFENKNSLRRHFRMRADKQSVIKNMELLIIDEVSMLRADLLDSIDYMMRSVRKKDYSFGGVQVLYIGDLLQLPPVVRNEEWEVLRQYYRGKFFFHSRVVQENPPLYIELSKIFRQTDNEFISVLNNLRNNKITTEDLNILNQFVQPDFDLKNNKGYITLTTHNAKADAMNAKALQDLKGNKVTYKPEIVGEFPEKIYPVDEVLQLKIGAQVMFVKNDLSPEKNYFNGKIGIIKSLSNEEILVHFPEDGVTIEVDKYEWKNVRYFVDDMTKEIREEVLGTFVHYPLKLAWAITVHKSQGLTFDKAALDVSQVFLPGQAYVALSRLRSLNGLILLSPLRMNGISNDVDVMDYATNKADEKILEDSLHTETRIFLFNFLKNSFDWKELAEEWNKHKMSYLNEGEKSVKTNHKVWAHQQAEAINSILNAGSKFTNQLSKIFKEQNFDILYVKERVEAAYNYFFKTLDNLAYEILYKIEEIKRVKKAKAFYEELIALEEIQINAVLHLMKAKLLIGVVVSEKEICKENLTSEELKTYKFNKIKVIKEIFSNNPDMLIENEEEISRYVSKKKIPKEPKKSTVQETFDLWQQKLSIKEIAVIRKLTENTIYTHFTKLIQSGEILITEVLPEDKISQLTTVFKDYNEESLNGLKEIHGDKFTWEELKMFKASLKIQK